MHRYMYYKDRPRQNIVHFQVDYFVGGLAPLESKEIAGIAVAFSIIAAVLLVVAFVFLVKHRSCIVRQATSHSANNPTLSTIWVRKDGASNGTAIGIHENNGNEGNNAHSSGFPETYTNGKESLSLYDQTTADSQMSLTSNGPYHSIKVLLYFEDQY